MKPTVRIVRFNIQDLETYINKSPDQWTKKDKESIQEYLTRYKELLERGIEMAELPAVFSKPTQKKYTDSLPE
jgi:lipoate-protein ligase A